MATKKTTYKTVPISGARAHAAKARRSKAAAKKASREADLAKKAKR
jgi:hypothetical protein